MFSEISKGRGKRKDNIGSMPFTDIGHESNHEVD